MFSPNFMNKTTKGSKNYSTDILEEPGLNKKMSGKMPVPLEQANYINVLQRYKF